MATIIAHKRGDAFSQVADFTGTVIEGVTLTTTAGLTMRCQVRDRAGKLVSELSVAELAGEPMKRLLYAPSTDTALWPLATVAGNLRADIQIGVPSSEDVISTQTFEVCVVEDVTV